MENILAVLVQILAIYLAADFVGGFFHWAEDTLGRDSTPFWGPVFVKPNMVHHERPGEMARIPWLINNIPIALGTVSILTVVWLLGALNWQWLLFGAIGGFNQQAHRFAHMPTMRLPKFVRFLQKIGLLQDARHHWGHHTFPHITRYCVLTPWLNPILDKLRFWRLAERILVPMFGAPRRPDLANFSWYRG